MKFELVAYINPAVEGQEPNDKLGIRNYLAHPSSQLSFTTSTGLIIPLNPGTNLVFATVLKPKVEADEHIAVEEMVPTKVHLPEVLTRLVADEIRDFLIDTYNHVFEVTYVEGQRFEIHDLGDDEAHIEAGKGCVGGEFQRWVKVSRTWNTGPYESFRWEGTVKGNRSFRSLTRECLDGLDHVGRFTGLEVDQPDSRVPPDLAANIREGLDREAAGEEHDGE